MLFCKTVLLTKQNPFEKICQRITEIPRLLKLRISNDSRIFPYYFQRNIASADVISRLAIQETTFRTRNLLFAIACKVLINTIVSDWRMREMCANSIARDMGEGHMFFSFQLFPLYVIHESIKINTNFFNSTLWCTLERVRVRFLILRKIWKIKKADKNFYTTIHRIFGMILNIV